MAYENGHLSGETRRRLQEWGSGFKLGGEGIAVAHAIRDCVAYDNRWDGFADNTNPACRLTCCTAWRNGNVRPGSKMHNFNLKNSDGHRRLLPKYDKSKKPAEIGDVGRRVRNLNAARDPERRADGSIDMHGLLTLRCTALRVRGAVLRRGKACVPGFVAKSGKGDKGNGI